MVDLKKIADIREWKVVGEYKHLIKEVYFGGELVFTLEVYIGSDGYEGRLIFDKVRREKYEDSSIRYKTVGYYEEELREELEFVLDGILTSISEIMEIVAK